MTPWRALRRFLRDMLYLPRWQKWFLSLALVAVGVGYGGQYFQRPAATTDGMPATATANDGAAARQSLPESFKALPVNHPWFGRVGLSVLVGFLAGWLFRIFTKIMAALAVMFFAAVGTVTWFSGSDAGLTQAATQEYSRASGWLTRHVEQWKEQATGRIPSAGGGAVGLFLGFRRKR